MTASCEAVRSDLPALRGRAVFRLRDGLPGYMSRKAAAAVPRGDTNPASADGQFRFRRRAKAGPKMRSRAGRKRNAAGFSVERRICGNELARSGYAEPIRTDDERPDDGGSGPCRDDTGSSKSIGGETFRFGAFAMSRRSFRSKTAAFLFVLVLGFGACASAQSSAAKNKGQKQDQGTTFLLIHVVGGEKPAPVVNASVYLHFQEKAAMLFLLHKNKSIELDLKTDNSGYASFPELPQGKLLIQVTATGWQPFGEYYELNQPKQTIEIKLEQPKTHWY
jgi:hypothetical protein